MGTRLQRPTSAPATIKLNGGGEWKLRRATTLDLQTAQETTLQRMVQIMAGHQAVTALRAQFGDLLDLPEGADVTRLNSVSRFLNDVELALICSQGWSGVFDEDGKTIAEPELGAVALLLADPLEMKKARDVLYAGLHAEQAEKNASAASPRGAAAAAAKPAPTAGA